MSVYRDLGVSAVSSGVIHRAVTFSGVCQFSGTILRSRAPGLPFSGGEKQRSDPGPAGAQAPSVVVLVVLEEATAQWTPNPRRRSSGH